MSEMSEIKASSLGDETLDVIRQSAYNKGHEDGVKKGETRGYIRAGALVATTFAASYLLQHRYGPIELPGLPRQATTQRVCDVYVVEGADAIEGELKLQRNPSDTICYATYDDDGNLTNVRVEIGSND